MTRTTHLLRQSDPARHLGSQLDERAETELTALTQRRTSLPRSSGGRQAASRRTRLQPILVTGLVATAVAAVSVAVLAGVSTKREVVSGSIASPTTPNSTPRSGSPTPTKTPYAGLLIAPDGWHTVTREQLHAYVDPESADDPANAAIVEEQDWLDIQCMAEHGYLYDPTATTNTDRVYNAPYRGLTDAEQKGYDTAYWGPDSIAPYNWRTAGCHGRSVHLTGQDDAH